MKQPRSAILKCGTAVSGNPEDAMTPLINMTVSDMVVVQRFCLASQADLVSQTKAAAQDKTLKTYQFNDIKNVASIVAQWLDDVIETCEEHLQSAKPTIIRPE